MGSTAPKPFTSLRIHPRDERPYRWSRNPQCVGFILGYVGYALLCSSSLALATAGLLGIVLGMSPFAEEPWLRERFGSEYGNYASRVPRFLGPVRHGELPDRSG